MTSVRTINIVQDNIVIGRATDLYYSNFINRGQNRFYLANVELYKKYPDLEVFTSGGNHLFVADLKIISKDLFEGKEDIETIEHVWFKFFNTSFSYVGEDFYRFEQVDCEKLSDKLYEELTGNKLADISMGCMVKQKRCSICDGKLDTKCKHIGE